MSTITKFNFSRILAVILSIMTFVCLVFSAALAGETAIPVDDEAKTPIAAGVFVSSCGPCGF